MKQILFLIIVFLFVVTVSGCTQKESEGEHEEPIITQEPEPIDHPDPPPDPTPPEEDPHSRLLEGFVSGEFRFPADEDDMAGIMSLAGLHWRFIDTSVWYENSRASFLIANSSESIISDFHLDTVFSPSEISGRTIYNGFSFSDVTYEQYMSFIENEWASFWAILGALIDAPAEVAQIGEDVLAYFIGHSELEQEGPLLWRGRSGEIRAEVMYTRPLIHTNPDLNILRFVRLTNLQVFEEHMEQFLFIVNNSNDMVVTVEQLGRLAAQDVFEPLYIRGRIEQLTPALPTFSGLPESHWWLPANFDLYRAGVLIDESGSIPVYILPTFLSESELAQEHIHAITIAHTPEPLIFVQMSFMEDMS